MDSFERTWQRWFPEDKPSGNKKVSIIVWLIGIIIGLIIVLSVGKGFYAEWLWFKDLGYTSVYSTIIGTRVVIFFVAAAIFAVLFLANVLLALRFAPKSDTSLLPWQVLKRAQPVLRYVIIIATLLLSLIFGLIAQGNWEMILQALNWQPFGITDPVFQKEVGFYMFSLPFLNMIRSWIVGAFVVSLIAAAVIYFTSYGIQRLKFDYSRKVMIHAGVLIVAIFGLIAWSYWLGIWELVYSSRGVVFGASYTDMHSKLPAQWILLGIVILFIITVFVAVIRKNYRLIAYGVGTWILAAILIGTVYPALVQRFQVQPSELAKEKQYIEYNIQFTRDAFDLSQVVDKPFPGGANTLSLDDVTSNEMTINNIRLWDHRPLKDTFNHIQSLRSYYNFNDVDIDRYTIDGDYREVMLSARELSIDKLPDEAQTWINQRLLYTHGYGITLSPVNEIDSQGLPVLMVRDIPPTGKIEIDQPAIYFGESTSNYVIVDTNTQEFDYPAGEDNVYGTYAGTGGISLNGFFNRLVYAWELGDFNVLISGELTQNSKLLYRRNIQERVNHLAPFLLLDGDPYVVVLDGKLYWIQDAYTASNRYPYSTPINGLNYVRNSVKVVVDAYNGDTTFYVIDPNDAIIQTYMAIFPEMFSSMEDMPDGIYAHLRYPEGLFNIQAQTYLSYHMTDARVFYNKEDLWQIPREVYSGNEQNMDPYYIIMRLPDEETEEFLLMMPFTPVNKKNTIGWLAARCDGDNYGKLFAYKFPKEQWVDGPSQIENRIGQDTTITEQLALWGRGGSTVIRGNLLLIPIGDSIMYVEPVFLQAENGGLPELKRVIIATGEKIAMEPTLAQSLAAIFGPGTPVVEIPGGDTTETPGTPDTGITVSEDVANLIQEAQQHYEKAQDFVSKGDWSGFGEEWSALQSVLEDLAALTAGQ